MSYHFGDQVPAMSKAGYVSEMGGEFEHVPVKTVSTVNGPSRIATLPSGLKSYRTGYEWSCSETQPDESPRDVLRPLKVPVIVIPDAMPVISPDRE